MQYFCLSRQFLLLCVSDIVDEDIYISTYCCPEPNTESTVQLASVSGFCTPECIVQALSDLWYVCCVLDFCYFRHEVL